MKKELVKITPEGLQLLTVLTNSSMFEGRGFYGKEIFFTKGFEGKTMYLEQSLGNIGAFARVKDMDKDIDIVIIGNEIIQDANSELYKDFVNEFEPLLNQNNSPYRRVKFITENHLIWYLERRYKENDDKQLEGLVQKYKKSKKEQKQLGLF